MGEIPEGNGDAQQAALDLHELRQNYYAAVSLGLTVKAIKGERVWLVNSGWREHLGNGICVEGILFGKIALLKPSYDETFLPGENLEP